MFLPCHLRPNAWDCKTWTWIIYTLEIRFQWENRGCNTKSLQSWVLQLADAEIFNDLKDSEAMLRAAGSEVRMSINRLKRAESSRKMKILVEQVHVYAICIKKNGVVYEGRDIWSTNIIISVCVTTCCLEEIGHVQINILWKLWICKRKLTAIFKQPWASLIQFTSHLL